MEQMEVQLMVVLHNLVLEGTDSSSTNAGDMILYELNTDDINNKNSWTSRHINISV